MAICPLCNALEKVSIGCPTCNNPLQDGGKVADYSDPYGHYNDEDTVKLFDGYPNTDKDEVCPHLLVCKECDFEKVLFIQEQ